MLPCLVFCGDVTRFRFQVFPEFLRQRSVPAARQTFQQQGFQPGVFLMPLGIAQQGAEMLAHVAIALGSQLTFSGTDKRVRC